MRRRTAAALLALAAALAWTSAGSAQDAPRAAAGDTVTFLEGGRRQTRSGVVVESAGFDRVVFAQGGKRTTLDGADVLDIRWGDAPRAFDDAAAALRDGDADAAAAGFGAVLLDRGGTRAWIVEHANAGLGEALLALAPRDDAEAERAVRVFSSARDANPQSLVLDRILAGLARAEIVRGHPDAAAEAALALVAAAKTAKRPAWEAEAELVRAQALAEKHEDAGALRVLDELLESTRAGAAATKDAELARTLRRTTVRAAVRKTWLLTAAAETSRTDDAAARARKYAAEIAAGWPDDEDVAAAAIGAEGVLLLAAGDPKHALRKFLEVEVAHFVVAEEAARALRYEAVCYDRLGDPKLAQDALRRLARTYPATEAARRAR